MDVKHDLLPQGKNTDKGRLGRKCWGD